MKRLHIHVGVKDIEKSVQFYSTLFGVKPAKLKTDYAKWMLEDPRINFSVSTLTKTTGVDHLGIQVDEPHELEELAERLKKADLGVYDEGETTCCYAKSDKAWVEDPSGVAWETYRTMAEVEIFKEKNEESDAACCVTGDASKSSCC
jgi:catechol 2,3-dioxygenase-like lactoylglutathione lyase family enzyme